jgi:hypothetical protein
MFISCYALGLFKKNFGIYEINNLNSYYFIHLKLFRSKILKRIFFISSYPYKSFRLYLDCKNFYC